MTKDFREFYDRIPAGRRARIEKKVAQALATLALDELREACDLTQVELAKKLKTDQATVSKIEHRTDMYLSTLEGVVAAMGGRLELCARFPSGEAHLLRLKARAKRTQRKARHRSRELAKVG